jgi:SNF2 family DNA or RNA helicase
MDEFLKDPSETKFLVVNKEMLRRQRKKYCHPCEMWEPKSKKEWPVEHHLQEHERYGSKFKSELKINLWPEIVDYDRWSSVIFDESHSVLASYKPSNVSQMMEGLLDLKADLKLALTGTPIRGNELNMWGYFNWLEVPVGGYWNFASSYFQVNEGFFGKTIEGVRDEARSEFEMLLSRYVLRRTRAEVRPDLPLGQRNDILVQMDGKHLKQYRDFEKMGEVELSEGSVSGQGVLSQLTRLRQMAFGTWRMDSSKKLRPTGSSPKIEWLMESFLSERGVTGDRKTSFLPEQGAAFKYVVASQFNEVLDAVASALGAKKISHLRIDGSVSGKKRGEIIQRFNSDASRLTQPRVLLLNSKAGGESIDLDAWCDDMVIMDETFIADDQVQLEGRINNRSGRVAPRTWWYVRTEGTIEQALADQNYRQHDMQHRLLDGRRGVELALHLIKGDE